MSRHYRLPWLLTLTSIAAALIAILLPILTRSKPLPTRFPVADGMSVRAEIVDVSATSKLLLRYSPIADEGVELEFWVNGRRSWHAYVDRLGTSHSAYTHTVECFVDKNDFRIRSKGSHGTIIEDRHLSDGALISREVFAKLNGASEQPKADEEVGSMEMKRKLMMGGFDENRRTKR
jgi:hypothetical protein